MIKSICKLKKKMVHETNGVTYREREWNGGTTVRLIREGLSEMIDV